MSNDYFKAQGWFKTYALNSQDSRGVFQQLVKEDEEAFRLASAETDRIKEEMNKKFGSGTIKYGSEIPQPEIKTPQAIFEFSQRNPAAEGGRMLNAMQVGEDRGDRTGFRKPRGPKKITDFPLEVQKLIKDFGIKKYNKLNNQQKYSVRNQPTSTTPYTLNYGKNKFDITVKGLTKKGANNVQELLNIINKEELTPENWFAKTSRKQGKKGGASAGVDAMARDLVKYLKGEAIGERTAIHQIIFDQLNIKDLIGDKADIIKDIDGKSFRQAKGTAAAAKSAVESSFDAVKLLNKEFILLGLTPPSPYKEIDLLRTSRSKFKFPSNKLDYVAQALGLGGKVKHIGHELWIRCMNKDKQAWDMMKKYNIQDVVLLEKVYEKMLSWIRNHPNHNSYSQGVVCPNCGGSNLIKRGLSCNTNTVYQRLRCKDCGKWSRSNKKMKEMKKLQSAISI